MTEQFSTPARRKRPTKLIGAIAAVAAAAAAIGIGGIISPATAAVPGNTAVCWTNTTEDGEIRLMLMGNKLEEEIGCTAFRYWVATDLGSWSSKYNYHTSCDADFLTATVHALCNSSTDDMMTWNKYNQAPSGSTLAAYGNGCMFTSNDSIHAYVKDECGGTVFSIG